MFFYVDESGNTGKDLFNESQGSLFYGLLTSKTNFDILARNSVNQIKQKYGIAHLHGKYLSTKLIGYLTSDLIKLQKKFKLRFDLSKVNKRDLAIISFFDQVFDQGMNPAYTWTGYWTPLRYLMLVKVACLFDLDTLKQSWDARICLDKDKSKEIFVSVCDVLLSRLGRIPDERSQQLIYDTLSWAKSNYFDLGYHCINKSQVKECSPNLIGFQFVLHQIGEYIKDYPKSPVKITIDNQLEYNKYQQKLADYCAILKKRGVVEETPLGTYDYRNYPLDKLVFISHKNSIGIELTDLVLWIYQRFLQKNELSTDILPLLKQFFFKTQYHEISINGFIQRFKSWVSSLPNFDHKDIAEAKKIIDIDEKRRLQAIQDSIIK
ncbi:DUF3800 domain-containing protein [Legionella qingyii]|uniref:DUF3800 domain-containing protein n=1 Tax=Legionella qingyii TaxID=2184757 RepID=A0ABY0CGP7_9GAMM|nr:DUF3800 domain-containing protein [Legionella qingyii]RUR22078.1 DUF3800 domain-containing protein [Legionella qingyii]RUR25323.1 DUF3800 domain-containing protein [Legionella qingyii]